MGQPSVLCMRRRPGSRTAQKMRSLQRREDSLITNERIRCILQSQIRTPHNYVINGNRFARVSAAKSARIPKRTRRVIAMCMEGVLTMLLRRACHNVYATTRRSILLPRDLQAVLDDFTLHGGSFSF